MISAIVEVTCREALNEESGLISVGWDKTTRCSSVGRAED